jgi:hypothetical protein
MPTCRHVKVFSRFVLLGEPPRYPWICKSCGETGSDEEPSMVEDQKMYVETLKKFSKTWKNWKKPEDDAEKVRNLK